MLVWWATEVECASAAALQPLGSCNGDAHEQGKGADHGGRLPIPDRSWFHERDAYGIESPSSRKASFANRSERLVRCRLDQQARAPRARARACVAEQCVVRSGVLFVIVNVLDR